MKIEDVKVGQLFQYLRAPYYTVKIDKIETGPCILGTIVGRETEGQVRLFKFIFLDTHKLVYLVEGFEV